MKCQCVYQEDVYGHTVHRSRNPEAAQMSTHGSGLMRCDGVTGHRKGYDIAAAMNEQVSQTNLDAHWHYITES